MARVLLQAFIATVHYLMVFRLSITCLLFFKTEFRFNLNFQIYKPSFILQSALRLDYNHFIMFIDI